LTLGAISSSTSSHFSSIRQSTNEKPVMLPPGRASQTLPGWQEPDPPNPVRQPRPCRQRPSRCALGPRDELPLPHQSCRSNLSANSLSRPSAHRNGLHPAWGPTSCDLYCRAGGGFWPLAGGALDRVVITTAIQNDSAGRCDVRHLGLSATRCRAAESRRRAKLLSSHRETPGRAPETVDGFPP
jgi:hypothetical protein